MKRFLALVLVVVLAFALSSTAYAASAVAGVANRGGSLMLGVYNSSDEKINVIPAKDIWIVSPIIAEELPPAKMDAFLKACGEVMNIDDNASRSLFWLDITGPYFEMKDFAYVRFPFRCDGKDPKFTVNGKDMEVVSLGESSYYAKLTEYGTVCITSG